MARFARRLQSVTKQLEDSFIIDQTMPVWKGTNHTDNNVGCFHGVSRTTVTGVTQAAGAVHQNLTITGKVTVTQPGQTFRNCRFTYSYAGDDGGGMVDTQAAILTDAAPTVFEFCEWEPTTPGDRYAALYGHDVIVRRSVMTKTVDGIDEYNPYAPNTNVELAGNWIGYLAWFADDRPEVGDGHNDGTHNDSDQKGSGRYSNIHGNFFQGAKYDVLNPGNIVLDSDYVGFTVASGNGTTPAPSPQQSQIYLAQHTAYYISDYITFTNNWCWNFNTGFKLQSNRASTVKRWDGSTPSGTRYPITEVVCKNNIFGGTPLNDGFSQRYYPIRYDSNCTVNGRLVNSGTTGTMVNAQDIDANGNPCGNIFAADANVVPTYGDGQPIAGNPVRHRVDQV